MQITAESLDVVRSIWYKGSLRWFVHEFSLQQKFQNLLKQQESSNVEWGSVNEER